MLLDFNFMAQKLQKGEITLALHKHDVFVPACQPQLQTSAVEGSPSAAPVDMSTTGRVEQQEDGHIFSVETLVSW